MFSSKSYVQYLLLSLVGYLGSHHHGLIQAKETQIISSVAIKTSLNVGVKSSTKMYGHRADNASENSKQPRTTKQSVTPHVYSLASHAVSSITVLPRLNSSIQPSRTVLYSRNFTAIFPSNSTSLPHGSENSVIDDCSAGNVGEKSCDTYVTRWVDFYLNVSINTMHVRMAVLLIWPVIVYKYSILIFQGINYSFESNFRFTSKIGQKRITLSISSKKLFSQITTK